MGGGAGHTVASPKRHSSSPAARLRELRETPGPLMQQVEQQGGAALEDARRSPRAAEEAAAAHAQAEAVRQRVLAAQAEVDQAKRTSVAGGRQRGRSMALEGASAAARQAAEASGARSAGGDDDATVEIL